MVLFWPRTHLGYSKVQSATKWAAGPPACHQTISFTCKFSVLSGNCQHFYLHLQQASDPNKLRQSKQKCTKDGRVCAGVSVCVYIFGVGVFQALKRVA